MRRALAGGLFALSLIFHVSALANRTLWANQAAAYSSEEKWFIAPQPGCIGEDLHFTETLGEWVEFKFVGTAVYLQATFAFDRGVVAIELDGSSEGNFDSWVVDTSFWGCGTLFSKQQLENTQHTLKATLVGAHNGVAKVEISQLIFSVPEPGDTANPSSLSSSTPPTSSPTASTPPQTSSEPQSPTSAPSNLPPSEPPLSSTSSGVAPNPSLAILGFEVNVVDPRVEWSSGWIDASNDRSISSCSTGTRVSTTLGAYVSFPFKGSAIAFKTVPNSQSGLYSVELDGQPLATLDGFSPSSALCIPSTPFLKRDLADVDHRIRVTLVGPSNSTGSPRGSRLEISEFTYTGVGVQGDAPTTNVPMIAGVCAAAVTIAISCLAAFYFYRRRKVKRSQKSNSSPQSLMAEEAGRHGYPAPGSSIQSYPQFSSSSNSSPTHQWQAPTSETRNYYPQMTTSDSSSPAQHYGSFQSSSNQDPSDLSGSQNGRFLSPNQRNTTYSHSISPASPPPPYRASFATSLALR